MSSTNPQKLEKNYTYRQLRKMYTAAARQARAAYKEVAQAYPGSAPVTMYKGDFKSFTTISKSGMTKSQLAKELASVTRYLQGTFSSEERYAQYRERSIETFQQHGYNVTEENFNSVQQFMKDVTDSGIKAIYGSDALLEAYQRAKKRGLTNDQFTKNIARWEANAADVEAGVKSANLRVMSYRNSGSKDFI